VERVDVLVVGGGIAGLASAWWLARTPGLRIALLERAPRCGTGSSGRSAAILRTFGTDPLLNALARAGAAHLRRPGALAPGALAPSALVEESGLALGAGARAAAGLRAALADGQHGGRELAPAAWRALVPHSTGTPELALHFPGDGRIDVDGLLSALERGVRAAGVELATGCEVRELLRAGARIEGVRLADGRELRAETVVLAAGGWAGALGARAGSRVELRPTRRHLMVSAPDARVSARWPVLWLEEQGFYCRPELGGLLLCACDTSDVAPDACAVDMTVAAEIPARAARALLGVGALERARLWCGVRTLTADGRFALGPDPDLAGLVWVAGLGGHGMTVGLELGRLAAELLRGRAGAEARALDPARLARAPATAV